ncbi:CoA transferase [Rhodococcus aetherivorans]|uniref:CoA transferase n=1 Tax=Rhodococcus aetherivorans TaxID=191292 RepID=UPI0035E62304
MTRPLALLDDYSAALADAGLDVPADPATGIRCAPAGHFLAARLPVGDLATGAVAAFASAADRYRHTRGLEPQGARLDPERIAASFAGDRMLRLAGRPVHGFAALSGYFAAADGWVRTHANYPHHRVRLLRALDLPDGAGRDDCAARIRQLPAAAVEDAAAAHDAIAVRVRTEHEWATSAQGRGGGAGPLVRILGRSDSAGETRPGGDPARPLTGIRVLDLTRVIAGPVAARALALLGADVLRVDPPALPEIAWQHAENGQGKRTALLDLRTARGRETCRRLLADADVLLTGYRPGALDALIGAPVHQARPGVVHGRVCAWGWSGPWAPRRGFDSIVQAASGIAVVEGRPDAPGVLPVQALDHASGYLLAAGVLDALTARLRDGRGRDAAVALARTGAWLLQAPGRNPHPATPASPGAGTVATHAAVTAARPALAEYPDYPFPARAWGADPAAWAPAPVSRVRRRTRRGSAGRPGLP